MPGTAQQSVSLVLSALMLQGSWDRARREDPTATDEEIERRMYRTLHDLERAQNRVDRRWIQLAIENSRRRRSRLP
jgi:hypothetical protein